MNEGLEAKLVQAINGQLTEDELEETREMLMQTNRVPSLVDLRITDQRSREHIKSILAEEYVDPALADRDLFSDTIGND